MDSQPDAALDRAVRKATHRLVPFLLLTYVVAYLDRTNLAFAKEAFQRDTGLSEAAYAFGAGLFFAGYAVLQVPSSLIMRRVGPRIWIALTMVIWGLISAAFMCAYSDTSFYMLRLLLGVAEAGFFPSVIYFLTRWFPTHARTRAIGVFFFGAPLAFVFGGPLSGLLLEINGVFGLKNWQWLFLTEGLLAIVVGIVAYRYLDDAPSEARWLSEEERSKLIGIVAEEERNKGIHGPNGVLATLTDRRVYFLALINFLMQMSAYGVVFYLPSIVARLLHTRIGWRVGLIGAIPWICALVATYFLPRLAERTRYDGISAVVLMICACGLTLSGTSASPAVVLVALCVVAAGLIAVQPLFWSIPTGYLGGAAAAGGIALINSIGVLGGFVAPNVKNWAEQASAGAGMLLLACATGIGGMLFLWLRVGRYPLDDHKNDPRLQST